MFDNTGQRSEAIAINERTMDGSPKMYTLTTPRLDAICEQDETKHDTNETKFIFSKMSRRKKDVLILCTVQNVLSACAASVLGPFYTVEAQKKGMSLTMIGIVFSLYQLLVFVTSPVVGKFMTRIGVKFVYISGVFIGGCCTILFGLLDKGPGGIAFTVMSILVRSVEAVGFSGFMTASMTIASSEFPDNVGSVLALQNTGTGLGYMIGPVVAGFLYPLGGYGLPFYALGVLNIIGGVLIYFYLNDSQNVGKKIVSETALLPLFRSLLILFSMLVVFTTVASLQLSFSTLSLYLEQFDISETSVGAIYAIGPLVYIVTVSIVGYISDAKDAQAGFIVFGNLLFSVTWMLHVPSPLLPFISASLLQTALARVLFGLSTGCLMVPPIKCMMKGALELKYEKNAETCALVSGLFNSASALGGFTGPIVGGALIERWGFPVGYTSIGLVSLFVCLLAVGYFCITACIRSNGEKCERDELKKVLTN